jgi:hypothetical protein
MSSVFRRPRNLRRALVLGLAALALSGCQVAAPTLGSGPRLGGTTVDVAMLLPLSSQQGGDAIIARSMENAARLAASEQSGVTVNLRVYNTDGTSATAASVARQAVQEGADVILGPLRSEATAAVGVAVANSGISVLSFSNNAEVAGGNVFVLGNTFTNTADRDRVLRGAPGRGQRSSWSTPRTSPERSRATRCEAPRPAPAPRSPPRCPTSSPRPA